MIIIVGESGARVHPAAFLLPQGTPPEAPLEDYLTSVGESERRTRLDFLRELPPPPRRAHARSSEDRTRVVITSPVAERKIPGRG